MRKLKRIFICHDDSFDDWFKARYIKELMLEQHFSAEDISCEHGKDFNELKARLVERDTAILLLISEHSANELKNLMGKFYRQVEWAIHHKMPMLPIVYNFAFYSFAPQLHLGIREIATVYQIHEFDNKHPRSNGKEIKALIRTSLIPATNLINAKAWIHVGLQKAREADTVGAMIYFDEALKSFTIDEKINETKRLNSIIHYERGKVYFTNEEYDKAIDEFLIACRDNTELVEALVALGESYLKKGELDKAINTYNQFLLTAYPDIRIPKSKNFGDYLDESKKDPKSEVSPLFQAQLMILFKLLSTYTANIHLAEQALLQLARAFELLPNEKYAIYLYKQIGENLDYLSPETCGQALKRLGEIYCSEAEAISDGNQILEKIKKLEASHKALSSALLLIPHDESLRILLENVENDLHQLRFSAGRARFSLYRYIKHHLQPPFEEIKRVSSEIYALDIAEDSPIQTILEHFKAVYKSSDELIKALYDVMAQVNIGSSYLYNEIENDDEAMAALQQAEENFLKGKGDALILARAYQNLGAYHYDRRHFAEATKYLLSAIEEAKKVAESEEQTLVLLAANLNLLQVYLIQMMDTAKIKREIYRLKGKTNNKFALMKITSRLGEIAINSNQPSPEEARNHFTETIRLAKDISSTFAVYEHEISLANVEVEDGNYLLARKSLDALNRRLNEDSSGHPLIPFFRKLCVNEIANSFLAEFNFSLAKMNYMTAANIVDDDEVLQSVVDTGLKISDGALFYDNGDFIKCQEMFDGLSLKMQNENDVVRREDQLYIRYFLGKLHCRNEQRIEALALFDEALSSITGETAYQEAWVKRLEAAKKECQTAQND